MSFGSALSRWRKRLLGALVVVWTAGFVATHVPPATLPSIAAVGDKRLHFAGYFFLTGMFALTLVAHGLRPLRRTVVAVISMMAYGAIDELTQPLCRRSASAVDWLADVAGALAAVAIVEASLALVRRRRGGA